MLGNVLCVLETRDGVVRKVSHEVVAAGRRIGNKIDALVLAAGPVSGDLPSADRVLTGTHADFVRYNPDGFAETIAKLAGDYDAIVFAATATGKDLAPRVGARLGVSVATDVTELSFEGGKVIATRPVYAGKALQRVRLNGKAVISVRPNTFALDGRTEGWNDGRESVPVQVPAFTPRVVVREIKAPAAAALDVSEATIIVSGGRGLKEPANFAMLEALAAAIGGAAVGASRAVVDAGWRDHAAQVGQTGKTVSPSLYIAVGISGAIQHLAGMRTSKVIVAINRDKDAPIFKVADYGIVGDLFEVVPRLTEEIRRLRA